MSSGKKIYFSFSQKSKKIDKDSQYLSNFFPAAFTKDGKVFNTVEHFFQSEKFEDAETKHKIISAKTPMIAKRLGRKYRIDPAPWILRRNQVMRTGLELKFSQNADLREKLLSTGNAKLIEFSIRDKYWGGSAKEAKNTLGNMLMEVRSSLIRT